MLMAVVLGGLTQAQYQPRYITGTVYEKGLAASSVGFTEQSLAKFKGQAWDWVVSDDALYTPTTLEELAAKLRRQSDSLLPSYASKDAKAFAFSYLTGIWTKCHMKYYDAGPGNSHQGIDQAGSTVNFEKRYTWFNVRDFLKCKSFEGACRHSAVLVRDVINSGGSDLGVKAHYVGAWFKSDGPGVKNTGGNHAYNLIVLSNGLKIPFDATGTALTLEQWRQQHRIFYPCLAAIDFPQSAATFEVFFAKHYGTTLDFGYGPTNPSGVATRVKEPPGFIHQDLFMSWKLDDWLAVDTTDIKDLRKWITDSYRRRR